MTTTHTEYIVETNEIDFTPRWQQSKLQRKENNDRLCSRMFEGPINSIHNSVDFEKTIQNKARSDRIE